MAVPYDVIRSFTSNFEKLVGRFETVIWNIFSKHQPLVLQTYVKANVTKSDKSGTGLISIKLFTKTMYKIQMGSNLIYTL